MFIDRIRKRKITLCQVRGNPPTDDNDIDMTDAAELLEARGAFKNACESILLPNSFLLNCLASSSTSDDGDADLVCIQKDI